MAITSRTGFPLGPIIVIPKSTAQIGTSAATSSALSATALSSARAKFLYEAAHLFARNAKDEDEGMVSMCGKIGRNVGLQLLSDPPASSKLIPSLRTSICPTCGELLDPSCNNTKVTIKALKLSKHQKKNMEASKEDRERVSDGISMAKEFRNCVVYKCGVCENTVKFQGSKRLRVVDAEAAVEQQQPKSNGGSASNSRSNSPKKPISPVFVHSKTIAHSHSSHSSNSNTGTKLLTMNSIIPISSLPPASFLPIQANSSKQKGKKKGCMVGGGKGKGADPKRGGGGESLMDFLGGLNKM